MKLMCLVSSQRGSQRRMPWLTRTWMKVGCATTRACANAATPHPLAGFTPVTLSLSLILSLTMALRRTWALWDRSKVSLSAELLVAFKFKNLKKGVIADPYGCFIHLVITEISEKIKKMRTWPLADHSSCKIFLVVWLDSQTLKQIFHMFVFIDSIYM